LRDAGLQPVTLTFVSLLNALKSLAKNKANLLSRSSLSNSACDVCGKDKLNLEAMRALPELPKGPCLEPELLLQLPQKLRTAVRLARESGGNAGWFLAR
jgi:FdhD protein